MIGLLGVHWNGVIKKPQKARRFAGALRFRSVGSGNGLLANLPAPQGSTGQTKSAESQKGKTRWFRNRGIERHAVDLVSEIAEAPIGARIDGREAEHFRSRGRGHRYRVRRPGTRSRVVAIVRGDEGAAKEYTRLLVARTWSVAVGKLEDVALSDRQTVDGLRNRVERVAIQLQVLHAIVIGHVDSTIAVVDFSFIVVAGPAWHASVWKDAKTRANIGGFEAAIDDQVGVHASRQDQDQAKHCKRHKAFVGHLVTS